ncbi:hypothetical protein GGR51DRAFT_502847 [Nemania sp. FL0031]|nr:hypothetical protein GGR51DRAFT_502847 [Nemania sp. FL0031]
MVVVVVVVVWHCLLLLLLLFLLPNHARRLRMQRLLISCPFAYLPGPDRSVLGMLGGKGSVRLDRHVTSRVAVKCDHRHSEIPIPIPKRSGRAVWTFFPSLFSGHSPISKEVVGSGALLRQGMLIIT